MFNRYALLLGLAFLCSACSSNSTGPDADDEFREVKLFNRGQTIVVPAPLGTIDSNVLGMAYDSDLNDKDSSGIRHRMYPYVATSSTDKIYNSSFTLLESRTELNANANVLFVSGGITRKQGMRYAVLKVESIRKVLTLQPQGAPLYQGRLYASKIYYGWTLDYVFEGDSSQLNEHVAANLAAIVDAGGDLSNEVSRLQLRQHLVTRGLTPRNPNAVVVAHNESDVAKYFTTSGSDTQTIAIEYECASTFTVPAVNIKAPKYTPGSFVLDSLGFSIAETQADGSSWDSGSDGPDPIVTVYLNGTQLYTTKISDVYGGTVGIGRRIVIEPNDQIDVVLWDEDDLSDNDFIGDFALIGNTVFSKYYIYDPLPLVPTTRGGQIKNVTFFITQAR